MYPVQRLPPNEALQRLDTKRELTNCKRALVREPARAQPLEIFWQRVLWPVDDPQIIAATHFNRRLGETPGSLNDEVEWLHDHTLAAAARQLFPPANRFRLAVRICDVHSLERRWQQHRVLLADARQRSRMPLVILVDMDGALRREQMKWSQPQVIHRTHLPAILSIRRRVAIDRLHLLTVSVRQLTKTPDPLGGLANGCRSLR